MRRLLVFAVVFAAVQLCASAKKVKVVKDVELPLPSGRHVVEPRFSPQGDCLLLNAAGSGLLMYDIATGDLEVISDAPTSGSFAKMSDDGKMVVYTEMEVGDDHLCYTSVKAKNLETGEVSTVVEPSRGVTAVAAHSGTAVAVRKGQVLKKAVRGAAVDDGPVIVATPDCHLTVTRGGESVQIDPCDSPIYLWASLSPDGTRLLFAVPQHGMIAYTSDLDGGNLVRLGRMSAPAWLGNDYAVGMVDADNGETITGSVLVAASTDGAYYTELTDGSEICMYPAGSNDATQIAYNTLDGKLHLMTVKTK